MWRYQRFALSVSFTRRDAFDPTMSSRLKSEPPALERAKAKEATPLLTVTNLRAEHRGRGEVVVAAEDVSFTLNRGECVALVGESGSGKTTIARTLAGLHRLSAGRVVLGDEELAQDARKRTRAQRQRIQIVFQDPSDALNPRHAVRSAVARPAQILRGLSRGEADSEAERLLGLVRVPKGTGDRYPGELSGWRAPTRGHRARPGGQSRGHDLRRNHVQRSTYPCRPPSLI